MADQKVMSRPESTEESQLSKKYVMRTLALRRVAGLRDLQQVRRIRNECRVFMTRDTHKISWLEQVSYWQKYKFNRFTTIFLGRNECNKDIAYGVIAHDERLQPWATGGLLKAYRGLGYGRLLFRSLCYHSYEPIFLEVLEENESALNLYRSLGFQELSVEKRGMQTVITMKGNCTSGSDL